MSFLGTALALEESSRVTGVTVLPSLDEITSQDGMVYLDVAIFPGISDATSRAAAASRFCDDAVAVIEGRTPDGDAWCAMFQLAPGPQDAVFERPEAAAPFHRALTLTGPEPRETWGRAMSSTLLRSAFLGHASTWTVSDMLLGLLVELTGTDMEDVVSRIDAATHPGVDPRARRVALFEMLSDWSALQEGPGS